MEKNPVTNLDSSKILVAPSVLAANFSMLGAEMERVEKAGCDLLHLDIMDGHFVPNLTMGPPVIKSIRRTSSMCFDTHLMITDPLKYVEPFASAGSDHITFHLESNDAPDKVIEKIREAGCSVGVCLKPKSPASIVMPYLEKIDLVLVMTVEPGFGGQSFMADMMPKVKEVKDAIKKCGRRIHLEVDGGIDPETVMEAAAAGANMMVAGTSVFRSPNGADNAISALHSAQNILY